MAMSINCASSSANVVRHGWPGGPSPGEGSSCRMPICAPGASSPSTASSCGMNIAEIESGAPMRKQRVDVAGLNGAAVAMTFLARTSTSATAAARSVARAVGRTLRRLQEQRVVQLPQPAKAVADG